MLVDYQNGNRTHSINKTTPYFNYFQYLPLRSQSNYSESELNTFINSKIDSDSKMWNTGSTFCKISKFVWCKCIDDGRDSKDWKVHGGKVALL